VLRYQCNEKTLAKHPFTKQENGKHIIVDHLAYMIRWYFSLTAADVLRINMILTTTTANRKQVQNSSQALQAITT
jgi:hypothetical protein